MTKDEHEAAHAFALRVIKARKNPDGILLARAYLSLRHDIEQLHTSTLQERKALRAGLRNLLMQIDSLLIEDETCRHFDS